MDPIFDQFMQFGYISLAAGIAIGTLIGAGAMKLYFTRTHIIVNESEVAFIHPREE